MTSRSNGSRPRPGLAPRLRAAREVAVLMLSTGTGIRRWLLLGAAGGLVFALGIAYLVRFFSSVGMPDFLPGVLEVPLFMGVAVAGILIAMWRLTGRISSAWAASLPKESLRDSMRRLRTQARAPRVVAIGGGTGLATLLRGLKEQAQLTGIVTVADDGGSSGRLREELGVLPPGDIRNCIVALADAEPLMKELFQYRFKAGDGLQGHSFGNLFIAAMSEVTGSFEEAVNESNHVLNVRGRIVPSTLAQVAITATLNGGRTVRGESNIPLAGGRIDRVEIEPANPAPYSEALEAVRQSQLTLIGPGSLYTSIMPNLLIPGLVQAIAESDAPVVYLCNVASQKGETEGFDVADHVNAILEHCPDLRLDYVIANSNMTGLEEGASAHMVSMRSFEFPAVGLVQADLVNESFRTHHHPDKLARAIFDLYDGEIGGNGRRHSWRTTAGAAGRG